MNKGGALLIALLITILVASDVYLFDKIDSTNREKTIISRVIDGDTIEIEDGRTIRLLNINSPEKGNIGSEKAAEFLNEIGNKTIEIEIEGLDKYNRVLARIYDPSYINLKIVQLGLANKFLVDEKELDNFDDAERFAISNDLGIWKKSKYYDCIKTKIDKENEIVSLVNSCNNLNINGFYLKDESRKTYKFQNIVLGSMEGVFLHSGSGTDNQGDLFWDVGDVWNNDRDSLYLFDKNGGIVSYESYGY